MGGLAFAIIIVIAVFAIVSKPNTFLTVTNSMVILRGMSTIAIVALGLLLVIIVGEIDLSSPRSGNGPEEAVSAAVQLYLFRIR